MIPVSLVMGWLSSVAYVSALSLWALVSGHWATGQAARVEVAQQEQVDEIANHPVEDKVVKKSSRKRSWNRWTHEPGAESRARVDSSDWRHRMSIYTPRPSDFENFQTLPDSSWVDLGDGRWCRMNAIAEARSVVDEESEAVSVESPWQMTAEMVASP